MVRAHVALRTSAGSRAITTELVWRVWRGVQLLMVLSEFGLPTAWHCAQPPVMADPPSQVCQRVGWALHIAGIVLFPEGDLLGSESLFAHDRSPGRRGMDS